MSNLGDKALSRPSNDPRSVEGAGPYCSLATGPGFSIQVLQKVLWK